MAAALIIMIGAALRSAELTHIGVEVGLMLVAVRAGWAVMSWAGKLYLLSDLHIVRISGVFGPQIHDIPLRKVAHTRLVRSYPERVLRSGRSRSFPRAISIPGRSGSRFRSPTRCTKRFAGRFAGQAGWWARALVRRELRHATPRKVSRKVASCLVG